MLSTSSRRAGLGQPTSPPHGSNRPPGSPWEPGSGSARKPGSALSSGAREGARPPLPSRDPGSRRDTLRARQGPGVARRRRRPVRPRLGSPPLISATGTRGAVTPGGPTAVGPAQAPEDTSPNTEPQTLRSAHAHGPGGTVCTGGTEAYTQTTHGRPHATHSHVPIHTNAHTHTHTHRHSCAHTLVRRCTHTRVSSFTHSHVHTYTLTRAHSRTHVHTHTHSRALILTLTPILVLTHTHFRHCHQ